MRSSLLPLGFALLADHVYGHSRPLSVPGPKSGSDPIWNDLQSFSIELAFFPDYAGNRSHPNVFTKNLLENFKHATGVYPNVRVGGTTQDHANYYPQQEEAVRLIFENPTDDQPIEIKYGPAFFESYHTLGDIKFIHGLNMAQNKSIHQLEKAAIEACQSLGPQLDLYELGNEWNFAFENYRPANYSLLDYVEEWNKKTMVIKSAVQKACPGPFPGFMAPSFVSLDFLDTEWSAEALYNLDYDPHNLTKVISFHNYMGVFSPPLAPVSYDLQTTLMNHTSIVDNLSSQIQRMKNIAHVGHPYTLGETNSIANQGRNGETNVFGDALWLVDFSLWAATNDIKRLNFHQGLNYRYVSWQPIASEGQPATTRPPYYGQIMVAKAVGHSQDNRIVNIPLDGDLEAAYGIYDGKKLSKLVVLNLNGFNQSTTAARPSRQYGFRVPGHRAKVERLIAPGSDSVNNVTFAGISYDHDLGKGKPVTVDSSEEIAFVHDGVLNVQIPDSSAALLTLL